MRRLLFLALVIACAFPTAAAAGNSIVGGAETERQWPWMVYLSEGRQEFELNPTNFCGGSLIDATWVLTAAHCITDRNLDPLITTVVIGRHSQRNDTGERIQVKRILVHEEYAGGGPDVALVELSRSPNTPVSIQVAGPGEEALYAPGVTATILGWGTTSEGGSGSDVLKEAQVPVVADERCGQTYSDPSWGWTADTMICAGFPEGGTDSCQGDSGGPMMVPAADGTWRQVGITSFGEGCARPGWPGVYTEAAGPKVREWIRAFVPGAIAVAPPPPPVQSAETAPMPAPTPRPAQAAQPAPPAPAAKAKKAKKKPKVSRAYKRCMKKAGRNKRKKRACRRAEAKRKKRAARR